MMMEVPVLENVVMTIMALVSVKWDILENTVTLAMMDTMLQILQTEKRHVQVGERNILILDRTNEKSYVHTLSHFIFCCILIKNSLFSIECNCNVNGSTSISCDKNGICSCRDYYAGDKCDSCKSGYYPFPKCDKGI